MYYASSDAFYSRLWYPLYIMKNKSNDLQKPPFQPYLFALKEGKKIQSNFLDYTLLLIQVHNSEVMHGPNHYLKQELALKNKDC